MVALRHDLGAKPVRRTRLRLIAGGVLPRVRRDALPEHADYRDTGCDLAPSCLRCPLRRCRYDEPRAVRRSWRATARSSRCGTATACRSTCSPAPTASRAAASSASCATHDDARRIQWRHTMSDAMTIPQQIRQMDADRLRRYAENLAFYGGDQWPGIDAAPEEPPPRLQLREGDRRQDGVVPDVRPQLRRRRRDDTPEAAERARAAERALREVYDANHLAQLDFDTEIDAAVLGDGAYKVTWDADGAARARVGAGRAGAVRLVAGRRRVAHLARRQPLHASMPTRRRRCTASPSRRARASRAGAKQPGVEIVEVWTAREFELWADGALHRGSARTRTASSRSSSTRTCASRSSSGACRDMPVIKEPVRELNRALSQLSMILELSRQPDRRAGERHRVAGHRRAAGRGVGAAGAGARLPARPAAGRRRQAARRLRRPDLPHAARPRRVAAHGLRREPRRASRASRSTSSWTRC